MAKISKEDQARLDGMAYALKIAKERGIEGLEEECKWRNATHAPVGLPRKAVNEFVDKVKKNTLDTVLLLSTVTLRDEFDFGEKRARRFIHRFNEKADCIVTDYLSWDDCKEIVEDELKIKLDIRQNNDDVKIKE